MLNRIKAFFVDTNLSSDLYPVIVFQFNLYFLCIYPNPYPDLIR